MQHHPDHNVYASPANTARTVEILEAYRVLQQPDTGDYDIRQLKPPPEPQGFGANVFQILNDLVDLGMPLSISGLQGILMKRFVDKKLVNWPVHQLGVSKEGEISEEISSTTRSISVSTMNWIVSS